MSNTINNSNKSMNSKCLILSEISERIKQEQAQSYKRLEMAIINRIIEMSKNNNSFKKLCKEGFHVTMIVQNSFIKSFWFKKTKCQENNNNYFTGIECFKIDGFDLVFIGNEEISDNQTKYCFCVLPSLNTEEIKKYM